MAHDRYIKGINSESMPSISSWSCSAIFTANKRTTEMNTAGIKVVPPRRGTIFWWVFLSSGSSKSPLRIAITLIRGIANPETIVLNINTDSKFTIHNIF